MNQIQKELSLIIPSYRKREWLEKTIAVLLAHFPTVEIIIVDDASKDNTGEIKDIFGHRIIYLENEKNMGKGYSLKRGFEKATGQYLIFTDDDLPYGVEGIKAVLGELKKGYEIVISQRKSFYNSTFYIRLARPFFYLLTRFLFGLSYSDTQCGLKGFKKEAGKRIFSLIITNGFAVDAEILYLNRKMKYKLQTVEVSQNFFAPSTFKLKGIILMLRDFLKITLHHYEIK